MGIYASVLSKKVALTSETSTTVIQLHAGLQADARIVEWGVSFDGTNSAATSARVRLVKQTTGGTMTQIGAGTAYDSANTASNASWRIAASSEPTSAAGFLEQHLVTPIGGLLVKQYPLGREPVVRAGERAGILVYPGLGSAASCYAYIVWEE